MQVACDGSSPASSLLPPPKWSEQQSTKILPCWSCLTAVFYSFGWNSTQSWPMLATLPIYHLYSARWETSHHGGDSSNQGLLGLLSNQFTPKSSIFPDTVFRVTFSLCPKAKAIWPQHTTAWSSSGSGWHKDVSDGTRTEPEQPWPHINWWVECTGALCQTSCFVKKCYNYRFYTFHE